MNIFDIAWLTFKWCAGISVGMFTVFLCWIVIIGVVKGLAMAISGD